MKAHSFIGILSVVVIAVLHETPARASPATAAADAQCSDVAVLSTQSPASKIVALFEGPEEHPSKPKWRVVASAEALKKAAEAEQTFWQAYLWQQNSVQLVKSVMSPESGDWVQFIDYCFDASGRLRRMVGQLNTFHGDVTRIRTTYFDESGRRAGSSTRVLTLQSQKPAPNADFMDEEDPIYLTMKAAPFKELFSP